MRWYSRLAYFRHRTYSLSDFQSGPSAETAAELASACARENGRSMHLAPDEVR